MERVDYESIVIQDLSNLLSSEELDLNPWYQRRSVWQPAQKAYLINSVFEAKPIPTIYIRHYLDVEKEKSIKEIVDGQQRLRAVFEYIADSFAARHPAHRTRVRYSELTPSQRSKFKMSKLSVGYLVDADDADVIDIFGRLNSVSKTLNAQEKRNAAFSGEMKQFCLSQAAGRVQFWRATGLFSPTGIARMDEVQFVSELALNMLVGLSDFSAKKLDDFYKKYDDTFTERSALERRLDRTFSLLAGLDIRSIRDTAFSRTPLFFSIFLILDAHGRKISRRKLEDTMHKVDTVLNADVTPTERPKAEAEFVAACTASTQRIKSRRARERYLKKALGIK
jgi:hypothetical protein